MAGTGMHRPCSCLPATAELVQIRLCAWCSGLQAVELLVRGQLFAARQQLAHGQAATRV